MRKNPIMYLLCNPLRRPINTSLLLAVLMSVAFLGCSKNSGDSSNNGNTVSFTGKVSKLKIPSSQFEGNWNGPVGLVLDDISNPTVPKEMETELLKKTLETIKTTMTPMGVTQTADFTYRKADDVFKSVTVRVFVFKDKESCEAFWKEKYESEQIKDKYQEAEQAGYPAIDSKEMSKRIARIGNVLITVGQLGKGTTHLKFLKSYIRKIKAS